LIDLYNKEWRFAIAEQKSRSKDDEGFKKIYVAKDSILTEEQVGKKGEGASGYFYRAKEHQKQSSETKVKEASPKQETEQKPRASKMANLLSCLKADGDSNEKDSYNKFIGAGADEDDDDDVNDTVERRMSMNQFNEMGLNFQKYQDIKPAAGVRREILNMFNEYKEMEDKQHAKDELIQICTQYGIDKYQFVGYFMSNSLAEKPNDFR